jgi:hypothetical protein
MLRFIAERRAAFVSRLSRNDAFYGRFRGHSRVHGLEGDCSQKLFLDVLFADGERTVRADDK